MLGNTCTIKWYQNLHYIFHSALKTSFKVVHYFLQSNILSQGLQMSKIHVINSRRQILHKVDDVWHTIQSCASLLLFSMCIHIWVSLFPVLHV